MISKGRAPRSSTSAQAKPVSRAARRPELRGLRSPTVTLTLTSPCPLGRLDTVTGPGGATEQSSTYDGFDNLISSTTGSSATTTSYNYDPLNRLTPSMRF